MYDQDSVKVSLRVLQVTDRTSSKMVPEQLKFLVRKLLVIISRVARLLEIMVGGCGLSIVDHHWSTTHNGHTQT